MVSMVTSSGSPWRPAFLIAVTSTVRPEPPTTLTSPMISERWNRLPAANSRRNSKSGLPWAAAARPSSATPAEAASQKPNADNR